jgi:tripartite-type tricarboxylate transporter receptor subunit TctC
MRSALLALSALSLFAASFPGIAAQSAKTYPDKPIRVIVAQTPGSSIDTMTRIVTTRMSELLGEQLVVDNRTGAGGTIGAGIVAHSEPNGYTLLAAATASQVIGPQLYKKTTTYEPLKDFTAVSLFAITENVLCVNPKTPFKTVKDLIAYAKANPGKINWANAGSGFQSHLAGVLFTHMAGINVLHVPYKGAGASVGAVISGESHLTLGPAPAMMPHVAGGRLRAIAMGGEKRSSLWPDLPTVIESGLPGYVSNGWAGVMVRTGTSKEIRNVLYTAVHKTVADAGVQSALKKVGADPVTSTPAEFSKMIADDWKRFGDAIRAADLKAN